MATKKKLLQAAAGNAGGDALNVEDVFSTYLYTGTGSNIVINNGIDLAGDGGLVWYRRRDAAENNSIEDTVRGLDKVIYTDSTNAQADPGAYGLQAFNSNGFTAGLNTNGGDYVSWTFRKAEKFFTCLTYTGDGTVGRNISHNLGSKPGCVIVKKTSGSEGWFVSHRGYNNGANTGYLNMTNAFTAGTSTEIPVYYATDTTFRVSNISGQSYANTNGATYVAYLFAHNDGDGDFGPDGDADIIKCGSVSGSSSAQTVDLGFEPQFILYKRADDTAPWRLHDVMRGMPVGGNDAYLDANASSAEADYNIFSPTPTGFRIDYSVPYYNTSGGTYIYIAIRRGTAVPESAAEVFGISYAQNVNTVPFPVDFMLSKIMAGGNGYARDRLRGGTKYLLTDATNAELSGTDIEFDDMTGTCLAGWGTSFIHYNWKRAPSYMDCVAYFGNGTAGRTVSHNLGVAPEMVWYKNRSDTINWIVYHKDIGTDSTTQVLELDTSDALRTSTAFFNSTAPSASVLTLGTASHTNYNTNTYIAYLFATLAGISKVGSYTGNGSFQTIDCGFSAGSRFVLIKRTDASGDWYVWDSERGITQAADPYLELNTTAAQTTGNKNYLYPASSGFGVQEINGTNNPNINVSSATYIFYAIA